MKRKPDYLLCLCLLIFAIQGGLALLICDQNRTRLTTLESHVCPCEREAVEEAGEVEPRPLDVPEWPRGVVR